MKLLYLNVFEGAKEKKRFNKIIIFVKKIKPDFVILLELDDWNKNNLKTMKYFSKKINLKCFSFNKGNIGFFSKYPILNVHLIKNSIIKIKIKIKKQSIYITGIHLNHKNEANRLKEIKILLNSINLNKKEILIGDFNSLSPLDNYNEKKILKHLDKIKLTKFGKSKLRKEVHKKLLKFGLIDCIRIFSKKFEYSVPTAYNKDYAHFEKLRLDYVYITENLKNNLIKAEILRNKETDELSDHFPVIAKFKF